MFGLDYTSGPPISAMKSAGVGFVCRYLSSVNSLTQTKLLSLAEAKALSQAGMAIVSNYEWYANRAAEGYASGVADAKIAAQQHAACGGPADRPIYFSVDFDTSVTQAIIDYFHGVASVIGLARTGAYGPYQVIRGLFDAHAITWGWQTYAWSGGMWEPRAHIRQYKNGISLAGFSVDYNQSMQEDFGQWMPGEDNNMMNITDPFASAYFTQTGSNPDRWHCAKTGQDLFAGILLGWRQMNGAPRLPVGPEVSCGKQAVYQQCESGIMLYDPAHEIDAPGGPWAPCYLLKLNDALVKQLLAIGQPAPVDITALIAAINAIPDAIAQATATATAQAVLEAKKL